jgi:hypothetical protein
MEASPGPAALSSASSPAWRFSEHYHLYTGIMDPSRARAERKDLADPHPVLIDPPDV